MKQDKARPVRWRLMLPVAVTFALLWLGVVAMLFSGSQQEANSQAALAAREIQDSLEEWWQLYKLDREAGKEDAGSILRQRLSGGVTGTILTSDMDGGMALLARDEDTGEVFRSQLAWGFGNEDWIDMDQRWYLTFDQGLDGAGQLALGRWITEHANGNGYILYPEGEMHRFRIFNLEFLVYGGTPTVVAAHTCLLRGQTDNGVELAGQFVGVSCMFQLMGRVGQHGGLHPIRGQEADAGTALVGQRQLTHIGAISALLGHQITGHVIARRCSKTIEYGQRWPGGRTEYRKGGAGAAYRRAAIPSPRK